MLYPNLVIAYENPYEGCVGKINPAFYFIGELTANCPL